MTACTRSRRWSFIRIRLTHAIQAPGARDERGGWVSSDARHQVPSPLPSRGGWDSPPTCRASRACACARGKAPGRDQGVASESTFVRSGLAGEERLAQIVYLAVTSRLLPWGHPTQRPVSLIVKAQRPRESRTRPRPRCGSSRRARTCCWVRCRAGFCADDHSGAPFLVTKPSGLIALSSREWRGRARVPGPGRFASIRRSGWRVRLGEALPPARIAAGSSRARAWPSHSRRRGRWFRA
jgi:hypothetical protein